MKPPQVVELWQQLVVGQGQLLVPVGEAPHAGSTTGGGAAPGEGGGPPGGDGSAAGGSTPGAGGETPGTDRWPSHGAATGGGRGPGPTTWSPWPHCRG